MKSDLHKVFQYLMPGMCVRSYPENMNSRSLYQKYKRFAKRSYLNGETRSEYHGTSYSILTDQQGNPVKILTVAV